MSSLSYAVEKLGLVVSSLVASTDKRRTLVDMRLSLMALDDVPLPDSCVESVVTALQAVGLRHRAYPVPIGMPIGVEQLPDSRLSQVAQCMASAFGDVSEAFGAERAGKVSLPAQPARYAWLRYRHLAWEGHENSADYLSFLKQAFPAYPDEVLQQWFARHGNSGMVLHAAYLDLERLRFELEEWPAERLPGLGCADPSWKAVGHDTHGGSWLRGVAEKGEKNWLASTMSEAGTWPTPPIVFADGGLLAGAPNAVGGQGYLLEGHRRLSFLMNLADLGRASSKHSVWVARY